MLTVLALASCRSGAPSPSPTSSSPSGQSTGTPVFLGSFPKPPAAWTPNGTSSLYRALYDSTKSTPALENVLPLSIEEVIAVTSGGGAAQTPGAGAPGVPWISDPVINAVAADLVVQFHRHGTDTLGENIPDFQSFENDLIVRRSKNLVPLPSEELDLGSDDEGDFLFTEVKEWVRGVLPLLDPTITCAAAESWPPWWFTEGPSPVRGPVDPDAPSTDEEVLPGACAAFVEEVQKAIQRELELQALRQDLVLIAYGEESVWDGQLAAAGIELRTYDLPLDVAAIGNILGSAPFDLLFDEGNQGEQCDSDLCPTCILPGPDLCGNGGVQGAEQCDDGNRFPGDGCDEFCQVEGNYCGNENVEAWEACDEGKECPNGDPCANYMDCSVGGKECASSSECLNKWKRVCPDGSQCTNDGACGCPPSIAADPIKCAAWKKNSCSFVFDGVCFKGGMLDGTPCRGALECLKAAVSKCGTDHFCTNLPALARRGCNKDEDCVTCTAEPAWGHCYDSGARCNGDEDCASAYCVFDVENACRPRTIGGASGDAKSSCGAFCEDVPRCGDRIVYLDEFGKLEECDVGMHCKDGTPCAYGEHCGDDSQCMPRSHDRCGADCQWQPPPAPYCGDGYENVDGEECDDGGLCENGNHCTGSAQCPTEHSYCENDPSRECLSFYDCPRVGACLPPNATSTCTNRSNDGCSTTCKREYCGDNSVQDGPLPTDLHEQCDPGTVCNPVSDTTDQCGNVTSYPDSCGPGCGGGCDNTCHTIDCGDGRLIRGGLDCDLETEGDNEECDDGNTTNGDGCDASCKGEYCGDGTADANGRDNIPGNGDDEECDPPAITQFVQLQCIGFFTTSIPAAGECDGSCKLTTGICPTTCTHTTCGDHCRGGNEECDDGNTANEDGCSSSCNIEYCGDGTKQGGLGEECDDGGVCPGGSSCKTHSTCQDTKVCSNSGGACTADADCVCGSAAPEDCTPGKCQTIETSTCTPVSCKGCSFSCKDEYCGNGVKECAEECDDENTIPLDGCDATCLLEFCGDGVEDADGPDDQPGRAGVDDDHEGGIDDPAEMFFPGTDDEECDAGWGNSDTDPDACRTDCRNPKCGDAVIDMDEQCDSPTCPDGELCRAHAECGSFWCLPRSNDGGCSGACMFEGCGDGIVQPVYGEECDNGGRCGGDPEESPCTIQSAEDDCGDGVACLPIGGDGCFSTCQFDFALCGNGTVDDEIANTSDEEECDPADLENGICADGQACSCPEGGASCSPAEAFCDLGACNTASGQCEEGGQICASDDDCRQPCTNTCTPHCKSRVLTCGDGYRDAGEQCDDGGSDHGCSAICAIEHPELCGNGVIDQDVGEECDEGHPYHSVQCTPFCRLPHSAPMCGDGRKDPSGAKREDVFFSLLTQAEGYRLDWRIPDGGQMLPREQAGGWYVTPRVASLRAAETPFERVHDRTAEDDPVDRSTCSLCGNGVINEGEECDSGRTTGFSFPSLRGNLREWRRHVWAANFARFSTSYYWSWYAGLYPFGNYSYEYLTSRWYLSRWDRDDYIGYLSSYGGWYWYYGSAAWEVLHTAFEELPVPENCSSGCRLQLCGNDRIEPGETCEDGNRFDGDGCSSTCFLEKGFNFEASGRCGDDVVSANEECDNGGVCLDSKGNFTGEYCRFDTLNPQKKFCLGPDGKSGGGDDGTCTVVDGHEYWYFYYVGYRAPKLVRCDAQCQIEPMSKCGDGVLEPYEECDNGGKCDGTAPPGCFQTSPSGDVCTPSTSSLPPGVDCPVYSDLHCFSDKDCGDAGSCTPRNGDGCSDECAFEPPDCGNGVTEPWDGEQCDPGGTCTEAGCTAQAAGGCSATCQRTTNKCGNGTVDAGEQCDQGSAVNSDSAANTCRTDCLFPYCGDQVIDREEECDDGNSVDHDGCTYCVIDLCGNGLRDLGEQCDKALDADCSEWCTWGATSEHHCGNQEVDSGEECDDGNAWGGDGCSAACTFEYCGNGVEEPGLGEECDDGYGQNKNAPDVCRLTCKLPSCGDGIEDKHEACDPGKHCTLDPQKSCKDDVECPGGECAVLDTTTCAANCTEQKCGDGFTSGSEQCDGGGGCSSQCTLEHPALCGNGVIDNGGEKCDDGNDTGGDGCTATCQLEFDPASLSSICSPDCIKPFRCLNGASCDLTEGCASGPCTLRAECAEECAFGFCGDGDEEPGEQCDDGRHCTHDPSQACDTHADCGAGSCQNADPAAGMPGSCSDEPARGCMTNADCRSLCVPKSGDGCSSSCLFERPIPIPEALIRVCREEVGGVGGSVGTFGNPIGEGQIALWNTTLLEPARNPFIGAFAQRFGGARYLGGRGGAWWRFQWHWWDPTYLTSYHQYAWPWYWGSSYWPSGWFNGWYGWWGGWRGWWTAWYEGCTGGAFPNAVGNHLQAIAGCLDAASRRKTIPDRQAIMPFQPTGAVSYMACMEPRAQLASAVEIPAVPPIQLPAYDPKQLIADFERAICAESGSPRRAFAFLCSEVGDNVRNPRTAFDVSPLGAQQAESVISRENLLTYALDVGYRSGASALSQYLEEAFSALAGSLATAIDLFQELQRVQFTDVVCPIDGSPFCSPHASP